MNWAELKNKIYYEDGSWRDVYILNANEHDWEKWVVYVNDNYEINCLNSRTDCYENKINFGIVKEFWSGELETLVTAKVFIGKIQVNAHFFVPHEIENDIDPKEFTSMEDHHKLIKFMSELSTLLEKEIILTPENQSQTVLIKVNGTKVEFPEGT